MFGDGLDPHLANTRRKLTLSRSFYHPGILAIHKLKPQQTAVDIGMNQCCLTHISFQHRRVGLVGSQVDQRRRIFDSKPFKEFRNGVTGKNFILTGQLKAVGLKGLELRP